MTTFDIVERIRCEAKEGLLAFRGDAAADKIIAEAKIGLEFDFDINETNKGPTGMLEFERSSTPAFSLVLDADKADRTRSNMRNFETLEQLSALYETDCSRGTRKANRTYPITGRIGIAEVIQTYIKLEKLTNVVRFSEDEENNAVFSDNLLFTTEFSAGATVNVEFDAVVGTVRLTEASLSSSASRKDIHSVTIALSRDPSTTETAEGRVKPPVSPAFTPVVRRFDVQLVPPEKKGRRKRSKDRVKERAVASDSEEYAAKRAALLAEHAAKYSTAENRILRELLRRQNLKEDRKVVERVLGRPLP